MNRINIPIIDQTTTASLPLLDTGHITLDKHGSKISKLTRDFLGRHLKLNG